MVKRGVSRGKEQKGEKEIHSRRSIDDVFGNSGRIWRMMKNIDEKRIQRTSDGVRIKGNKSSMSVSSLLLLP